MPELFSSRHQGFTFKLNIGLATTPLPILLNLSNSEEAKISETDQEEIAGGYGDIREIVDLVVLRKVNFK